jgi:peptidoglycan/LPS O-acetylase OafA/YrhL
MPDDPISSARPKRFLALDLVRGMAAFAVVIYHYAAWNSDFLISSAGMFSVYLFFTLSALSLLIAYETEFSASITSNQLANFYIKRVARILPLLAVAAALEAAVDISGGAEAFNVLARAALTGSGLMALHAPVFVADSVAWSLGIEIFFYALFPILALSMAQMTTRGLVLMLVCAVAAQMLGIVAIWPLEGSHYWDLYTLPLTFAPFFAAGFLIYRLGPGQSGVSFWMCLVILTATLGFSGVFPGVALDRSPSVFLALSLGVFAIIHFAYRAAMPRALRGLATYLGSISYAVYLTHSFVYRLVSKAIDADVLSAGFRFPVFVLATVLTATVIYRYFERPAQDLIRARFARHIPSPALAPGAVAVETR